MFTALLFSCADKGPDTETKNQIIGVADAISKASASENVNGLMSHLTKDITINIDPSSQNPKSYNYNSYKKYLSKVFSLISNYKAKRSHEKFSRLPNGDYSYEFSLTERYVLNNQDLIEVHNQVWHLKKVNKTYKAYKIVVNP